MEGKGKGKLKNSILGSNPVTVLALGICSALAVTVHMKDALIMGLAVTVISAFSSFVITALRKTIPQRIRIIVEILVVSFFVILADQLLKAFAYTESKQLSVYVGLIITNCIILGRLESHALGHGPVSSLYDGFSNGIGYALILLILAFFRELFGCGTLFGAQVIPAGWYVANGGFYENNGLMLTPPMALILIGCIVWLQRTFTKDIGE